MRTLKDENLNKCFSLLKEFIEDAEAQGVQKGMAILALDQLKQITAGDGDPTNPDPGTDSGNEGDVVCLGVPRGYPTP